MKYLTILLLLVLVGCGNHDPIDQEHLDVAAQLCERDGGVSVITESLYRQNSGNKSKSILVQCKSGSMLSKYWIVK